MDAALRDMYGAEIGACAGVVHVAAVWEEKPDQYFALAIGEHTPRSQRDHFALEVARARADAIITTGRILRAEPALRHDLRGSWANGLAAWRRERLGKRSPPLSLVLTSGFGLPLAHPLFGGRAAPIVYTGHAGRALEARLPGARLVAADNPDIHGALDYLQNTLGCRTVVIEAGPSTARALYGATPRVDELMLSILQCPGAALPAAARGPGFIATADIGRALPCSAPFHVVEGSAEGTWQFHRFCRE